MTKVKVNSGACGFESIIVLSKSEDSRFNIEISSGCEMVEKLAEELKELEMMDAFKAIFNNPVFRASNSCLRHVSCPVPVAVLKALEVEAGLAVARNVKIEIHNEKN